MIKLAIQGIVLIDYIAMAISWLGIPICDFLVRFFDVHFSENFMYVHSRILIFSTIIFVIILIALLFKSLFALL